MYLKILELECWKFDSEYFVSIRIQGNNWQLPPAPLFEMQGVSLAVKIFQYLHSSTKLYQSLYSSEKDDRC